MIQLDQTLLRRARHKRLPWQLSEAERIAINVLRRDKVTISVLTEVFRCSRNTIYYNCLTGTAPSYPPNAIAIETNAIIDEMGIDRARELYVTPAIIEAVDRANRKKIRGYR